MHAFTCQFESTFYASLAAEFNVTLKDKKHSSGKSTEDKWVDCIGGQYWIKSLLLFERDQISLESGNWLSDAHIMLYQNY